MVLDAIVDRVREASKWIGTIGVSLTSCSPPGTALERSHFLSVRALANETFLM